MAAKLIGNAVVGQSGGPTAVINQSLVGVIQEAQKAGHIEQAAGRPARRPRHRQRRVHRPQGRSPRTCWSASPRPPPPPWAPPATSPTQAYCQKIFEVFKKNNVRYFFYIGGNDSADTARIVNEMASRPTATTCASSTSPRPSTTTCASHDHRPGYGSAAKFVASRHHGRRLRQPLAARASRSTSSWAATPAG